MNDKSHMNEININIIHSPLCLILENSSAIGRTNQCLLLDCFDERRHRREVSHSISNITKKKMNLISIV